MVDSTLRCIRESMLELLREKEYSEIQMKEIAESAHIGRRTLYRYFENKEQIVKYVAESLMDNFAEEIEKQDQMTLYSVTYAFYSFIEKNKGEFELLKSARLLGLIEDNLLAMISRVAVKTKYKDQSPQELKEMVAHMPVEEKYEFHYTFAGYWSLAMAWLEEEDNLSVEEITKITIKIMSRRELN